MNNTIRVLIGLATAGTVVAGATGAYVFLSKDESDEEWEAKNKDGLNKKWDVFRREVGAVGSNGELYSQGNKLLGSLQKGEQLTDLALSRKFKKGCDNRPSGEEFNLIKEKLCK